MFQPVHVIGGGLAGSEAAWQLARAGYPGNPPRDAPGPDDRRAQDRHARRAGLLQLVPLRRQLAQRGRAAARGDAALRLADHARGRCAQAAGGRRARGRSGRLRRARAGQRCEAEPLVEIRREEVPALPDASCGHAIVATGPLTSPELAQSIRRVTGEDALAFFDAIAPIVHRDSIDFEVAWLQSRYDKPGPAGTGADYVNCPLDRGAIPGIRRGAVRRRQARVQGVGDLDALLRGLPADRGDGGARARTRCATGR